MTFINDLFADSVPKDRAHPNFIALRDSRFHNDARAFMNTLYSRMGDPNGRYVGNFQSDGFHARLFELACFAYLESAGLVIDRGFDRPDFLASQNGVRVALEATTANPPAGQDVDLSINRMKSLSEGELEHKVFSEFPARIVALLRKKLRKRYHKLPQCAGVPLVFIVAPFFEPGSILYTDEALLPCLYGYSGEGVPEFPETPFFRTPGSESVAAVLYCNQFTVPRFWRLAPNVTETARLPAVRYGVCYVDRSATEFAVCDYYHDLNDISIPRETWAQGVTVFHNPNATVPLPPALLPCTSTFRCDDGALCREVHGFHPATSFMHVTVDDTDGLRVKEATVAADER